jgi:hypothetical protein
VATAAAGAVLGINPFDQPNVAESKDNTNRLLKEFEDRGSLPEETPALSEGPLSFYLPEGATTAAATLARFLGQARPGDYVALLAYLTAEPAVDRAWDLRHTLRDVAPGHHGVRPLPALRGQLQRRPQHRHLFPAPPVIPT